MQYSSKATMMIYVIVLFLSEFTLTVSFRLKGAQNEGRPHSRNRHNSISSDDVEYEKRGCDGFPCMYSHLGTKAAHASLYNTLAGFIDNCLNDPACDPGRRKRDNSERIKRLMKTPMSKLHLFDQKRSSGRL